MPHQIIHPTKEQVRAYLAARKRDGRPPPSPEAIRRRLGWRLEAPVRPLFALQIYQILTSCAQFSADLAVVWMYACLGARVQPSDFNKNYL